MKPEQEFQSYETDQFFRRFYADELLGGLIFLVVQVVIWGLLSFFLPDGWWHLVINIGGFLFTAFTGMNIRRTLIVLGVPRWLTLPGATFIWFVIVIVGRSIELNLLDAVL